MTISGLTRWLWVENTTKTTHFKIHTSKFFDKTQFEFKSLKTCLLLKEPTKTGFLLLTFFIGKINDVLDVYEVIEQFQAAEA